MKVCEFVCLCCMAYLVKLNRVILKKKKTFENKGKRLKNGHGSIAIFDTFRV